MLNRITDPMLRAREALRTEYASLHGEMPAIVKSDPVCRWFMTLPGVRALLAITFKSAVDDPGRVARSMVGAHFGLTPGKYQSRETDVTGAISRVGGPTSSSLRSAGVADPSRFLQSRDREF